jgi:menaquinone-dependent protoporphyrinogen IX oxidase
MGLPPQSPFPDGRERVLVAYYSRTNTTRSVAHCLAHELGATVEIIAELRERPSPRAMWRCAADALLRRCPALAADLHDAADYDLVVVGTPVWYATVSSPARSYLARHAGHLKDVAFFVTCGGWRPDRALRHMALVSRCAPRATMAITRRDLLSQRAQSKIHTFAAALGAPKSRWASSPWPGP